MVKDSHIRSGSAYPIKFLKMKFSFLKWSFLSNNTVFFLTIKFWVMGFHELLVVLNEWPLVTWPFAGCEQPSLSRQVSRRRPRQGQRTHHQYSWKHPLGNSTGYINLAWGIKTRWKIAALSLLGHNSSFLGYPDCCGQHCPLKWEVSFGILNKDSSCIMRITAQTPPPV